MDWSTVAARKPTLDQLEENRRQEDRLREQRQRLEEQRQLDLGAHTLLQRIERLISEGDSGVSRFHAKDYQYAVKGTYPRAVVDRAGELWVRKGGGRHILGGPKQDWREGQVQTNFLQPVDPSNRDAGKHNVHVNVL